MRILDSKNGKEKEANGQYVTTQGHSTRNRKGQEWV